MKERLKISAVSYLNTSPYIAGLKSKYDHEQQFIIGIETPAECALKLQQGKADLGLVPVATIPSLSAYRRVTDWGIVGDGPVASVLLTSEVPLHDLKYIYLDYQSNTSNNLLKLLLRDYLEMNIQLIRSQPGYEQNIRGATGGLLIGNRALHLGKQFKFRYDLSELWKQWTGLPFVFARWVGNSRVKPETVDILNRLFNIGLEHREEIAVKESSRFPEIDVLHYLNESIVYQISEAAAAGEALFLEKIGTKSVPVSSDQNSK